MSKVQLIIKQDGPSAMKLDHPNFQIVVDRPKEKGGGGTGLMGGQYLLTGIGGCFCSTLFAAAESRNVVFEGLHVIIEAELEEELPKRFSAVTLKVSYQECSNPAQFEKLLKIAEKGCISVNTIKAGMEFNVTKGPLD